METGVSVMHKNRQRVTDELGKLLADEFVVYTKTKNAHWNVEGADFLDKHKFFEQQFNQLDDIIDRVAERIRSLGHYTNATLKTFLELTHLSEARTDQNDSLSYIKDLLQDHESIIANLNENIKTFSDAYRDYGTADFITSLMEEHEKMAWFLRAHLGK